MTNVVPLLKPPSDLAARLRELADEADAGTLTDLVCAYTLKGSYEFVYGASLHSCVVMVSMLQQNCIDRMRV